MSGRTDNFGLSTIGPGDSLAGDTRDCTVCGLILPLSRFHRQPGGKKGRTSWCKECTKEKARRRSKRSCSLEGCDHLMEARGMCSMHYQRWRKTGFVGGPAARGPRGVCALENCGALHVAKGYCALHYDRVRAGWPVEDLMLPSRQRRSHRRVSNGYVYLFRPDHPNADKEGWVAEHRLILATMLNRPLAAGENGHHKNGDRFDNRLDNLELWSVGQPPGQRVQDKIAWAVELLTEYLPDESVWPNEFLPLRKIMGAFNVR